MSQSPPKDGIVLGLKFDHIRSSMCRFYLKEIRTSHDLEPLLSVKPFKCSVWRTLIVAEPKCKWKQPFKSLNLISYKHILKFEKFRNSSKRFECKQIIVKLVHSEAMQNLPVW